LDVADFPILCFNPSLIPSIEMLEPKVFVFFLLNRGFNRIRSMLRVKFFSVFNFQQHPAFPDQYDPDNLYLLNHSSKRVAHFPFPDMREFNPEIADKMR
jgi:hypothetical protein